MRVAVTYDNETVFQHFGQTERFKVYDIDNGEIVTTSIVNTNGNGHGALAGILKQGNVDILICGGIGAGARSALGDVGIKLYGGVEGNVDKAVEDLLADKLLYKQDVECGHHHGDHHHGGHHHHGDSKGHHCGEHKGKCH